jgi:hypothetical protein
MAEAMAEAETADNLLEVRIRSNVIASVESRQWKTSGASRDS